MSTEAIKVPESTNIPGAITPEQAALIQKAVGCTRKEELIVNEVKLRLSTKNMETVVSLIISIEPISPNGTTTIELDSPIEINNNLSANSIKDAIREGYLKNNWYHYTENPNIVIKKYTIEIAKEFERFKDFKNYAVKLNKE